MRKQKQYGEVKVYKANHAKLITQILQLLGVVALMWYFKDFLFRFLLIETLVLLPCLIGILIITLFQYTSKVEFEGNILKINYLLTGKKTFDFSKIKDFSVSNNFSIVRLYYIDNQKPTIIRLSYFTRGDSAKIADNIAAIMEVFFINCSEEQLDQFYEDDNQYNFEATEKHIPIYVFLVSMLGFITFVFLLSVVLLLIYPPHQGIFSVIKKEFLWFIVASWIVVYWIDAILPKRTLVCENGVITVSRKEKIIYTFHAKEIIKSNYKIQYKLTYKEFEWCLKSNPKKEYQISLMGFSGKEKRVFRNKLELVINFASH
jgi:hypothetical protein